MCGLNMHANVSFSFFLLGFEMKIVFKSEMQYGIFLTSSLTTSRLKLFSFIQDLSERLCTVSQMDLATNFIEIALQ